MQGLKLSFFKYIFSFAILCFINHLLHNSSVLHLFDILFWSQTLLLLKANKLFSVILTSLTCFVALYHLRACVSKKGFLPGFFLPFDPWGNSFFPHLRVALWILAACVGRQRLSGLHSPLVSACLPVRKNTRMYHGRKPQTSRKSLNER